MIEKIFKEADERMQKCIHALKSELMKLRTGRATPSLLDHIRVSYYGNETVLNQVANISLENARTLTVTPWEKPMIPVIEKAIQSSDLGLNPVTSGNVIRVPLPALTEERRKELAKVVREEAEKAKVSIRNVRRDCNNEIKVLLKDKQITEDEEKKAEIHIQKLTDQFIVDTDKTASEKEKEVMAI
jgi:ribosome recycling factor